MGKPVARPERSNEVAFLLQYVLTLKCFLRTVGVYGYTQKQPGQAQH